MKKLCVAYDVSSPHSSRFQDQSVEPFQRMTLPPKRSPFYGAGIEVEHSTDGSTMAVDVQFVPVLIGPFFLFGSCHAYPEQVRGGMVDGPNHRQAVLIRKHWLKRW